MQNYRFRWNRPGLGFRCLGNCGAWLQMWTWQPWGLSSGVVGSLGLLASRVLGAVGLDIKCVGHFGAEVSNLYAWCSWSSVLNPVVMSLTWSLISHLQACRRLRLGHKLQSFGELWAGRQCWCVRLENRSQNWFRWKNNLVTRPAGSLVTRSVVQSSSSPPPPHPSPPPPPPPPLPGLIIFIVRIFLVHFCKIGQVRKNSKYCS